VDGPHAVGRHEGINLAEFFLIMAQMGCCELVSISVLRRAGSSCFRDFLKRSVGSIWGLGLRPSPGAASPCLCDLYRVRVAWRRLFGIGVKGRWIATGGFARAEGRVAVPARLDLPGGEVVPAAYSATAWSLLLICLGYVGKVVLGLAQWASLLFSAVPWA